MLGQVIDDRPVQRYGTSVHVGIASNPRLQLTINLVQNAISVARRAVTDAGTDSCLGRDQGPQRCSTQPSLLHRLLDQHAAVRRLAQLNRNETTRASKNTVVLAHNGERTLRR